jgi:hypothetical protein
MWAHFWSDLTIGQVLGVLYTGLSIVLLVVSGRAARNARQGVRLMKRLIASVGLLPEEHDHRQGQTLTAQFRNLAAQVEELSRAATGTTQEKHDEPSVRASRADAPQARRH